LKNITTKIKLINNMKISREFKVGVLAVLCAVILYFGLNFLKGVNIFSSTATYVGQYENISGLTEQAPVLIKGYQVGLVESIQYDFTKSPSFTVAVSIAKEIQLPQGTKMALVANGLLGGMAIELQLPETSGALAYQRGDTLPSVVVPGLFESLEQGILAKLDSVLGEANTLVASLNNSMEEGSLYQTLQNVEQITADLKVSGADLRQLTHKQLPTIIAKVDTTITGFAALATDVREADIVGLVDSVQSVIAGVNGAINSNAGTLGLLLNDKTLYDNLNVALEDLDHAVLNVDSIVMSIKARPFIKKKLPK
jgi:phospholipid/cholesterol/gamma-HCH transport system substrate-binding protein